MDKYRILAKDCANWNEISNRIYFMVKANPNIIPKSILKTIEDVMKQVLEDKHTEELDVF